MALVIVILVHVLAVMQYGCGELQGREGRGLLTLPSLDEVLGNGSMLVETTEFENDDHVAFQTMNFTCSGNLTKLIFLALPRPDAPGSGGLYFGIGMLLESNTFVIHKKLDIPDMDPIGGSGTGYELNYQPGDVSLQEGHMLALFQHSSSHHIILLQKGEMIKVCRFGSEGWQHTAECTDVSHRPLVAVETDHPQCVSGFISKTALQHIMPATELATNEKEVQFKRTNFTCAALITRWVVGASITDHRQNLGQILIQNDASMLHETFALTSLNTTSHLNVYEYQVSQSKFVENGHFIVLNSSQIYYQRCGLSTRGSGSCVGHPLVAVEYNCFSHCSTCALGFIGVDELREKARYIPNFATEHDIETITIPFLRITQDGNISKWTFTAKENNMGTEYPKLFLLPPGTSEDYNIHDSVNDNMPCLDASQAIATEYPNVYELSVDPPVPVRVGDYIAIRQPSSNVARMMISFVKIPRSVHQEINLSTTNQYFQLQPLVHLEIVPSVDGMENQDNSATDEGSNTGPIVGGVVAALVIIVAAGVIVVIVVVLYGRRKRGKFQGSGTTNPTYDVTGSVEREVHNVLYAECMESKGSVIYAEPSIPGIDYRDPEVASNQLPPNNATLECNGSNREYAQLNHVTGSNGHMGSVSNPGYCSTQPHALQNHYEYAIYVPTKEQREQLSDENHVYATLEEAQIGDRKGSLTFFEECDIYWNPATSTEGLYSQLAYRKYREIPSPQIKETDHLGSGQFGTVMRGVWQDGSRCVDVAIKKLQEEHSEDDTVRFLQEAAIMGQFRHPNIVQLLGVLTVREPVMIVTELAHNGDLRTYLLATYSPDPGELPLSDTAAVLSQFCLQVARGMEYLSSKSFVHRDLAARNILVTQDKTCKISDFGMSRDLDGQYYVSQGGQIPVKWTAPEALQYKKYSTASDVWSFGCLMYEIWSLGHKPFEGYTNIEAIKLVGEGNRLAPPPGCPKEIYHLMITCWNADKAGRPQFREIVNTLSQSEEQLLHIPEEVTRGHPQASILGAPLEAGRELYTELQNTYL